MKLLSASVIFLSVSSGRAAALRRRAQATILPLATAVDNYYETIQETRLDIAAPGPMENDGNVLPMTIVDFEELDKFQGKLKLYEDGRLRYDPPKKSDFLGADRFTYETCQVVDGEVTAECASATVTIEVIVDPNKPSNDPTAVDDNYEVEEGGLLKVGAPGLLANDEHESDKAIYLDKRTSSPKEGKASTNKDGGFEYTAPHCWTGEDTFKYRACYVDYDSMCDEAEVTIRVKEDTNRRPNPPSTQNDRYVVRDGESLEVSSSDGILSNDGPDKGQTLFVNKNEESSGFEGSLRVRSDGRITYTPVPGKLGNFWFSYEACYSDWSCVECRSAMVEIVVETNPNKPPAPSPVSNAYEVAQGESLDVSSNSGVLSNANMDSRYNLYIASYSYDGQGSLKLEEDGSFKYQPESSFLGTESFSYSTCYAEWPDLCAEGDATITVKVPSPPGDGDSGSRRGVATAYLLRWDAADEETGNCGEVKPSLRLSCGGEGEIDLLEVSGSDNALCVPSVNDTLLCSAANEGTVYVECRDGPGDNPASRQVIATMNSDPVHCEIDTSKQFPLSWTYHAAELMTYCNDNWDYRGANCTGALLDGGAQSSLCYGDNVTSGNSTQPEPVTVSSANYEDCLYWG